MNQSQTIAISVAKEGLQRTLNTIASGVPQENKNELLIWAQNTILKIRAANLGPPGCTPKSGNLNRLWTQKIEGGGENWVLTYINTAIYARIQEYGSAGLPGGVVRSTRPGGWLVKPLPGSLAINAIGGNKFKSPLRSTLPKELGFWIKREKGVPYLGESSTGQFRAWYKLMPWVKVEPRLKARETIKASVEDLKARLVEAYRKLWSSGGPA